MKERWWKWKFIRNIPKGIFKTTDVRRIYLRLLVYCLENALHQLKKEAHISVRDQDPVEYNRFIHEAGPTIVELRYAMIKTIRILKKGKFV